MTSKPRTVRGGRSRVDGGLTSAGTPAHPTRPEVVSIESGDVSSSNRTFAYDARFQNGWPMTTPTRMTS